MTRRRIRALPMHTQIRLNIRPPPPADYDTPRQGPRCQEFYACFFFCQEPSRKHHHPSLPVDHGVQSSTQSRYSVSADLLVSASAPADAGAKAVAADHDFPNSALRFCGERFFSGNALHSRVGTATAPNPYVSGIATLTSLRQAWASRALHPRFPKGRLLPLLRRNELASQNA
jgi:hypothetical protein